MSNHFEPTPAQRKAFDVFLSRLPAATAEVARKLPPWKMLRLASTGERVFVYSYSDGPPVTVTVVISGKFNVVMLETRVFGIDPNHLTECELPKPGEEVGVVLTAEGQRAYIDDRRARNGLPPLERAS